MHTSNIQNEHDIIFRKICIHTQKITVSEQRGHEQLQNKEVMNS